MGKNDFLTPKAVAILSLLHLPLPATHTESFYSPQQLAWGVALLIFGRDVVFSYAKWQQTSSRWMQRPTFSFHSLRDLLQIGNRIKAKGLQKLRWFCQMCQKQCRDENGFKCHLTSDSHRRQMELFGQNPHRIVDGYSEEFHSCFMEHMRRAYAPNQHTVLTTMCLSEFVTFSVCSANFALESKYSPTLYVIARER